MRAATPSLFARTECRSAADNPHFHAGMCHYADQANYELPLLALLQALIAAMWLLVLAATLALAILLSQANARYLQIAPVSISSEATLNVAARKTPVIIFTTAKFTNVT